MKTIALLSALTVLGLQQATAQVTAVDLGTGLPPATLGGYTMVAYQPGTISGESYTAHEVNGNGTDGWATWGQSYTGAVHVESPSAPLTLTLSGVEAVYFYEEPNQFLDFLMTATDSSGASVSTVINGDHGSSGVGFYEDVAGGPYLTSITVTCSDPSGFAIGEFGIDGGTLVGSIPDTGSTLAFMALGLCGLLAYSRFSRVTV